MIELNLIEAAAQSASIQVETAVTKKNAPVGSGKKNHTLMVVLVVLACVFGFIGILKVVGIPQGLEGVLPVPVLKAFDINDPSRDGPEMNVRRAGQMTTAGGAIEKRKAEEAAVLRTAQSLSPERAVSAVQPEMFSTVKRGDYASMFPMEKIIYQKEMAQAVFEFINKVTPDGVSFAELVFAAPSYYYIRGVAESPVVQRNYLDRLKSSSTEFKTPELPENAPATSVTAYGVLNQMVENLKGVPAPFVKDADVSKEIDALRGLDANGRLHLNGLKVPKVEDFGVYKSYTYNVTTKADFQMVLGFVSALKNSPVRVGVERIRMVAAGKNGISTTMTLVVYTSN